MKFSEPTLHVSRSAFTLIELLVSISILVLLVAILLPVLSAARERGRQAHCQGNLKQLRLALEQYVEDNDGVFNEPAIGAAFYQAAIPDEADSTQLLWLGYLQPYIKEVNLAICPSVAHITVHRHSASKFTGTTYARVNRKQLSIGMISFQAPWRTWQCQLDLGAGIPYLSSSSSCTRFFTPSSYKYPAKTAIFMDSVARSPQSSGGGYWADPMSPVEGDYGFSGRHNQGTNVAFLDGHVKWYKTQRLIASDHTDDKNGSGQCVNYNQAKVTYDPTAPDPDEQALCEGQGLR